jgi:putative DNA methylase
MTLQPFSLKDTPALIEHLLPVQKLSAESFKEQDARQSKTLTGLGSYWKGRKPLILNKACILSCLLPVTDNLVKDLEVFELLMAMDNRSMAVRHGRIKPADIVSRVKGLKTYDLFETNDEASLPELTPFDVKDYPYITTNSRGDMLEKIPKLLWRDDITEEKKLKIEAHALPYDNYKENVSKSKRPEEIYGVVHNHIWAEVNLHLGTSASSFPELVEQLGIARFGHRPKVADVFCGSGQIPFEAARLGCDVYASDLNPIACMLTWGAFNIVGASPEKREKIKEAQSELIQNIQSEIEKLDIESDGNGWQAKAFLYCNEIICPESGWKVPLLSDFVISKDYRVFAKLIPVKEEKRYEIKICFAQSDLEFERALTGTIVDSNFIHSPDGKTVFRTSISSLRGDYKVIEGNSNKLRLWEKTDFIPRPDDIFQERLYCILWMKPKKPGSSRYDYEFRAVTEEDLEREQKVIDYVAANLQKWQEKGYVPDMVIERGYNTDQPIRERGWTHWHHLFTPRQLLINSLINKYCGSFLKFGFTQVLNNNSRLSRWNGRSGIGQTASVFDNQALNTLYDYGARGFSFLENLLTNNFKSFQLNKNLSLKIKTHPADELDEEEDIFVTDPPYGDAVKYEEITEFFIAWLRKNPPKEFAHWTWDSRRSLAIKGEDEGFRREMIAAYRKMAEMMPDNGIQVLMFTHQSGSIWADMANIIWASGLQVTAAWYVVTETDSALRRGANVTGTIMLVLRKRHQKLETFRDDLGWEIEDSVKKQVESLAGLDKTLRGHGSEGLYNDADLQMAGYAAALKVLTAYSIIDGKDMTVEAEAPRQSGRKTFVEELIDFAVQTAVQFLVPIGFEKAEWQKLSAIERFYLKMAEIEHQGEMTLDNYQNFAKAFKIRHFDQLMSEKSRANNARLKLSTEFKSVQMSGDNELADTPLRALLYAMFELSKDTDIEDVLLHLMDNCPAYSVNKAILVKIAEYLADKRATLKATKTFKPDQEAANARILAQAIANQRL